MRSGPSTSPPRSITTATLRHTTSWAHPIQAVGTGAVGTPEAAVMAAVAVAETSRLGSSEQCQRFLRINAAVVERAAGDGAFQHAVLRTQQRLYVINGGQPAGSHDRNARRTRQLGGRLQVQPLQDAVTLDVGVDDGCDARVLETACEIDHRKFGRFRPAFNGDLSALGVDADGNAAGEAAAGLAHELGVTHGRGAE